MLLYMVPVLSQYSVRILGHARKVGNPSGGTLSDISSQSWHVQDFRCQALVMTLISITSLINHTGGLFTTFISNQPWFWQSFVALRCLRYGADQLELELELPKACLQLRAGWLEEWARDFPYDTYERTGLDGTHKKKHQKHNSPLIDPQRLYVLERARCLHQTMLTTHWLDLVKKQHKKRLIAIILT